MIKQIGPEVFENKVVANKEGLLLFGIQFLKAAQFVEENNPEIYVQNDMWWLEDEIVGFKEIEIKQEKMSNIFSRELKPTWKD